MLALGLQAHEDDLCPGCGYPRTYTMHKDAKDHFHASAGIRCHACTPKLAKEQAAAKNPDKNRPGAFFVARPDRGMTHAMADPVLTYAPDQFSDGVGASGTDYSAAEE